METNWKLIAIISIAVCFAGCSSSGILPSDQQQLRDTKTRHFALFSWVITGNEYDFAIVPTDRDEDFLGGFKPGKKGIHGLKALKAVVEKLPVGSLINWNDAKHLGLEYPPTKDIDRVVAFARSKGIRIELNPVLYE